MNREAGIAAMLRGPQSVEEAGVATALGLFGPDGQGRAGWPSGGALDVDPDHPLLGWLEACERRGLAERVEGRWRLTAAGARHRTLSESGEA